MILFPVCSLQGHSFDTSNVACRLLRQVPPNPAPLSIPDALCAERPKFSTRPGRGGADSASKEVPLCPEVWGASCPGRSLPPHSFYTPGRTREPSEQLEWGRAGCALLQVSGEKQGAQGPEGAL